ncbi:MAG: signal peptidase I [Pseudoramibacter sp.]
MSEVKDTTKKQRPSLLSDLLFLLLKIGIIALFVVIIFTFFFGIVQVKDNAMDPAVKDGDLVIYYRLDKNYVASDLLVLEKQGKTQVRRAVGIDGDKIDINRDNGLEINGYPQQEDNIYTETLPVVGKTKFPLTVRAEQVFVLGDNRKYAVDSRTYGCVDKSDTRGKVIAVIRRRNL